MTKKAKFCVNSRVSAPWDYIDNDSSSNKQKLYGTIKLKSSDYAQVVFDSDGGKANISFTDLTLEDNDAGPALLPSDNEESDKDENLDDVLQDWSDDNDAEYVPAEPSRKKIGYYESD